MSEFLNPNWCGLSWSDWISFDSPVADFKAFETGPGLYRVRPVGKDVLMYIGQTRRDLRERIRALVVNTKKEEMPWNDPHICAPCLWAWADFEGWKFEISGVSLDLPGRQIQGLEASLFWQYRTEKNATMPCNFGKFHPDYIRPKGTKSGIKGGRLPHGKKNPKGGECSKVLPLHGAPTDSDWMKLKWEEPLPISELKIIRNNPCVYKIWKNGEERLYYIGQSLTAKNRLRNHSKKSFVDGDTVFSVCYLPNKTLDFQLKEIEFDLIGAYYSIYQDVPIYQFANAN
jgi:hypothetical protein